MDTERKFTTRIKEWYLDFRHRLVRGGQLAYNGNRPPTWGTPETSPGFFDDCDEKGFPTAFRNFARRSDVIGNHGGTRAISALSGAGLWVLASMVEKKVISKNGDTRRLPARRSLVILAPLAIPLLRYGCGESMTIVGRSEPGTTYDQAHNTTVHLTGSKAREYNEWLKAHNAFTPDSTLPPCGMEAFNKFYEEQKGNR